MDSERSVETGRERASNIEELYEYLFSREVIKQDTYTQKWWIKRYIDEGFMTLDEAPNDVNDHRAAEIKLLGFIEVADIFEVQELLKVGGKGWIIGNKIEEIKFTSAYTCLYLDPGKNLLSLVQRDTDLQRDNEIQESEGERR